MSDTEINPEAAVIAESETAEPETQPGGEPETQPGGEPETQPGGEPETQPGGEPETQPGGEPETQPGGEPQAPQTSGQSQSVLRQLLVVQTSDIEIAQLIRQRDSLPERQACQETQAKLEQAEQLQAKIKDHLGELEQEKDQTEKELADLESRLQESNTRLYSGEVTGMRAIEALQEQINALKRKSQIAEEIILDISTRSEEVEGKRDLVDAKHTDISSLLEQQTKSLESQEAELNEALEVLRETRQEQIAGIPENLLADYEARCERFGGVGIASLVDGHCVGCDLNIQHPVAEVERMLQAPPDSPVDCSECGRIIIVAAG